MQHLLRETHHLASRRASGIAPNDAGRPDFDGLAVARALRRDMEPSLGAIPYEGTCEAELASRMPAFLKRMQ